jgi:methylmalonyl-CoA mutase
VCLCASDPLYAEHGAAAAATLRQAGATRIYVAGRNVDVPGADEEVGIGCDALDVLAGALDALGVAP